MTIKPPSRLLGILDYGVLGEKTVDAAKEAQKGGVGWLLLRAKGLSTEGIVDLAGKIIAGCPGVCLSIHGDLEAARAVGAFGVHFASTDIEKCEEGGGFLRGGSCHNPEELKRAADAGADYVFLSPVFAPVSKKSPLTPLGVQGFKAGADQTALPVFALGGLRPEHALHLALAGAAGVAVVGDLFLSEDIRARAAQWRRKIEKAYPQEHKV